MLKQTLLSIKRGSNLSAKTISITDQGCRQKAQLEAVCKLHKDYPSAWWCSNPFEPEIDGKVFTCTFMHEFFTVDGLLTVARITPAGKIKDIHQAEPRESFAQDAKKIVQKFGGFEGDIS